MMLTIGITAIAASLTGLLYYLLSSAEQRLIIKRRLGAVSRYDIVHEANELSESFYERVLKGRLEKLSRLVSIATPQGLKDFYESKLDQAGNPFSFNADRFILFKEGTGFILALFFFLVRLLSGASLVNAVLYAVLGFIVVFLVFDIWLFQAAASRSERIRKELPDFMDLLVICIEAGLGYDAALARIVKHSQTDLSREMARVLYEVQMGLTRREAFRNLYDRTGVEELKRLAQAITQSDLFGVSATRVIKTLAEELRQARKQAATEKAQKIGVKITFPLILFIFPAMFVVILGPAAINLITTFLR